MTFFISLHFSPTSSDPTIDWKEKPIHLTKPSTFADKSFSLQVSLPRQCDVFSHNHSLPVSLSLSRLNAISTPKELFKSWPSVFIAATQTVAPLSLFDCTFFYSPAKKERPISLWIIFSMTVIFFAITSQSGFEDNENENSDIEMSTHATRMLNNILWICFSHVNRLAMRTDRKWFCFHHRLWMISSKIEKQM